MAWTIVDAVDLTRNLLQDQSTPYRHSDAKLVSYYNHALLEANRLRPDLFLATSGSVTKYTEADITAETAFPVTDFYITPVSEYMAGLAALEDDEFAVDGRAVVLLQTYRRALTGAT